MALESEWKLLLSFSTYSNLIRQTERRNEELVCELCVYAENVNIAWDTNCCVKHQQFMLCQCLRCKLIYSPPQIVLPQRLENPDGTLVSFTSLEQNTFQGEKRHVYG